MVILAIFGLLFRIVAQKQGSTKDVTRQRERSLCNWFGGAGGTV
jgi:hypothetical protein